MNRLNALRAITFAMFGAIIALTWAIERLNADQAKDDR